MAKIKVHIVCYDDAHIVPRMARWLAEDLRWSISDKPDSSADVNYYMPYTMWGRQAHPRTLTAAWFTHYELGNVGKMQLWERAAREIDGALVTAAQYGLLIDELQSLPQRIVKIDGAVDLAQWRLPKKERDGALIGLVGVGSARKGVQLANELLHTRKFELCAAGSGWGDIEHQKVQHDGMSAFYEQLRAFLCTSTIEGVPEPPIEALAMGVPVVVPIGVGMLDQLPDIPGVYRFEHGNMQSLITACEYALACDVPRDELRAIVKRNAYTRKAWAENHKAAMQELVQ